MVEDQIVRMGIDDLFIDPENVRKGKWDYDEKDQEMLRDVKEHGIQVPLLVRPHGIEYNYKHGVVCGGRRYGAAVSAGLVDVPVIVKKLTDREAATLSLRENRLRKEAPRWLEIDQVLRIYNLLPEDMDENNKIDHIRRDTGMSHQTTLRYIKVGRHHPFIKELLRPRQERSDRVKELEMLYRHRETNRTLSISNAELIADCLGEEYFMKQMAVAVFLIGRQHGRSKRFIKLYLENPEESFPVLWNQVIMGKDVISRILRFDKEIYDRVEVACMDRQMGYNILMPLMVKDWLVQNNYLSGDISRVPIHSSSRFIEELQFSVDRYTIKITWVRGRPVIQLRGPTSAMFIGPDIDNKQWRKNVKLPQNIVNVFDSIVVSYKEAEK